MNGSKLTWNIDFDAEAFGRAARFTAREDARYYLNGVHVVPGSRPRLEATDGHRLYCEEDDSAVCAREAILHIGRRGHALLKRGNRVRVTPEGELSIYAEDGKRLYVEPSNAIIDARFPNIANILGDLTEFKPGLVGEVNADYLRSALELPGSIQFWSRGDARSVWLFTLNLHPRGGKAFGAIMPMHGSIDVSRGISAAMPKSVVEAVAAQKVSA